MAGSFTKMSDADPDDDYDYEGDDVGDAEDKISCCTMLAFAAPTVATLPVIMMFNLYLNKSYETFGASLAVIAFFTALARSFDIMSDPLMSYITDTVNCGSWGRRRPFMLIGCFAYSSLLYLLLSPPYAGEIPMSVWYGVFYTLFFLSSTFVSIPYDALGPELSTNSAERTKVFFTSNVFDGLGTLVAVVLPTLMTTFVYTVAESPDSLLICKPEPELVGLCLGGKSSGDFLYEGKNGFAKDNSTLKSSLANLSFPADFSLPGALKSCIDFEFDYNITRVSMLPGAVLSQQTEFCNCMATYSTACQIQNQRKGFEYVGGIFSVYFVITMCICVYIVRERPSKPTAAPPIVPSLRSTLLNKPFSTLLPAWMLDAIGMSLMSALLVYLVEAVVAPEYMTQEKHGYDCYKSSPDFDGGKWIGMAGRQGSDEVRWECRSMMVLTISVLCALLAGVVSLPLWMFLARKFGKVQTWLWWSLSMAASLFLLCCIFQGQVKWAIVVSAINGLPLGAKFLPDAILSDIIDYDEFLTGQRREATYFMFRSFLPKMIAIPTSALPIAFLGIFDYRKPTGGLPSRQPDGVGLYIKGTIFLGCLVCLCSYVLKRKYPIKDADLPIIQEGIELHQKGEPAYDPVRNILYKIPAVEPGIEQKLYFDFGHFRRVDLQLLFGCAGFEQEDGSLTTDEALHLLDNQTFRQQYVALGVLILALVAAGFSMPLLDNATLQFIPTLLIIIAGGSCTFLAYFILRRRACLDIEKLADEGELTDKRVSTILQNRSLMANKPMSPKSNHDEESEESLEDHEHFFFGCDGMDDFD